MSAVSFFRTGAPLLLVLVLGLAACDEPAPSQPKAKTKSRPHLVEVVMVESRSLAVETIRTGTLAPRRSVRLFTQEDGRVDTVTVREGDKVAKGDVLLTLDRRLLMAERDKAEARLREAEGNLERVRELSRRKVTTQERLDKAETDLSVARAEAALIRTRLGYAKLHAPFDGVVTERLIEPGDVAARHTHVLSLLDPSSLYTSVSVSELMLPHLQGGSASVRIDALGDHVWTARIARVHPTVDPRTRQGTVEVDLVPVPRSAASGQLARVTLRTAETVRRLMPFAALRHDGDGSFVFVVDGGKAELKRVRSGLRIGDFAEVLEGLVDGENVVVRGFLDLTPGKAVGVIGTQVNDKSGS